MRHYPGVVGVMRHYPDVVGVMRHYPDVVGGMRHYTQMWLEACDITLVWLESCDITGNFTHYRDHCSPGKHTHVDVVPDCLFLEYLALVCAHGKAARALHYSTLFSIALLPQSRFSLWTQPPIKK